jgi:hypothetical protein
MAGNMVAEVARDGTGIGVVAATRGRGNDHLQLLPLINARQVSAAADVAANAATMATTP